MGTSPLSFIVLVTFLFADHKCFKLLLLLHMLVQASIKCLLKWFTDDKNDFHLSLDNIFYFILSAFLTDSKELCVFYGCVIIISLTFETFLLSIWMHWKAKCVHTDVAGHCFQTERRNSVCKEVKSLSFCLLFLFSHSSILLSVCLLSRFLFVHLSILSVYLPISLCPAIYLRPKDGQIAILTQGCVLALRKESHGGALESHVLTAAHTQNTKQHI